MKKFVLYLLSSVFLLSQTACYGSFEFVKKVYEWNDGATENKFVKSILMWAMFIIPVYEIAGFVDLFILNLIEFWKGSNPMAMSEGEVETQIATINGKEYKITATKNQFMFEEITKAGVIEVAKLKYIESSTTWVYQNDNEQFDLVKINEDASLTYFTKAGELNIPMEKVMAFPQEELASN